MRKVLVVGIIVLFLLIGFYPASAINITKQFIIPFNSGNTLYVGGSEPGNYTKIQDAIDNTNNGDTVFVYDDSSPYKEHIIVDKSINLLGENKDTTIIDGWNYTGDVVYISADGVKISGFWIQNSGLNYYLDAGIEIISKNNTIINNKISHNACGIRVISSSNNVLSENNFWDNYGWETGGGIYLYESNTNTITNSNFSDNDKGLLFDNSFNNIILGNSFFNDGVMITNSYQNTFSSNTVNNKSLVYLEEESNKDIENAGQIILVKCDNITVKNQEISNTLNAIVLIDTNNCLISNSIIKMNNKNGIRTIFSNNNNITSNYICSNKDNGIEIKSSNNNIVTGNNISLNEETGLHIRYSDNNTISDNIISTNNFGWTSSFGGIFIRDSSDYNYIIDNIITSNDKNGIRVDYSRKNIIAGNRISSNTWDGIHFLSSHYNSVMSNIILENGLGISALDFDFSTISSNIISYNNKGIDIEYSHVNTIQMNNLTYNKKGLFIEDSEENIIRYNNFIDNEKHGSFRTFERDFTKFRTNHWMENYYSGWINIIPKPIFGKIPIRINVYPTFIELLIPCFVFDWNPSKVPYDIN